MTESNAAAVTLSFTETVHGALAHAEDELLTGNGNLGFNAI